MNILNKLIEFLRTVLRIMLVWLLTAIFTLYILSKIYFIPSFLIVLTITLLIGIFIMWIFKII